MKNVLWVETYFDTIMESNEIFRPVNPPQIVLTYLKENCFLCTPVTVTGTSYRAIGATQRDRSQCTLLEPVQGTPKTEPSFLSHGSVA